MHKFFKSLLEKMEADPMFGGGSESQSLESEFTRTVRKIKEKNSKDIWDAYYIPKAVTEILEKHKSISHLDNNKITLLAQSLMFRDLADGKLNEFYKFEE
jgi:hypothetical protein